MDYERADNNSAENIVSQVEFSAQGVKIYNEAKGVLSQALNTELRQNLSSTIISITGESDGDPIKGLDMIYNGYLTEKDPDKQKAYGDKLRILNEILKNGSVFSNIYKNRYKISGLLGGGAVLGGAAMMDPLIALGLATGGYIASQRNPFGKVGDIAKNVWNSDKIGNKWYEKVETLAGPVGWGVKLTRKSIGGLLGWGKIGAKAGVVGVAGATEIATSIIPKVNKKTDGWGKKTYEKLFGSTN